MAGVCSLYQGKTSMQEFLGANPTGPGISMEDRFEDRHLSGSVGWTVSNKSTFTAILNSVFSPE